MVYMVYVSAVASPANANRQVVLYTGSPAVLRSTIARLSDDHGEWHDRDAQVVFPNGSCAYFRDEGEMAAVKRALPQGIRPACGVLIAAL